MKEFDVRVQSLIYQITTLSKLEAEKAEKKLLYDYLAAVMQELPEEPKARAHMLDAMERTVKDLEQRKNGEAGLNIGGSLLGTIPPGGVPCVEIACQTPTQDPPKRQIPEMG